MYVVNYELPETIDCFVSEQFLYNFDKNKTGVEKAKIVSLNFYKNEAPTLSIITEDGSLFDYCPLNLIGSTKDSVEKAMSYGIKELSYNNNQSEYFIVNEYNFLKNKEVKVYLKQTNEWHKIEKYICSIDWFKDNDKKHFFILDNGVFALIPNHKLKTNGIESFKKYKKIKQIFKI